MPEKKEKTKKEKEDKLEQLIEKLEDRLAIFNETELKKLCLKHLIEINECIKHLEEEHRKMYDVLGLTWGEINCP